MQLSPFDKANLVLTVLATATISILAVFSIVQAGPTLVPPNGNPAFPAGSQGPRGDTGLQGNQGAKGDPGVQGSVGNYGRYGIGACDWNGGEWVSYGWNGGCAWDYGAYFYCDGSRMYSIVASWRNNCGDAGGKPSVPGWIFSDSLNF
ncbi:MAG: collagen-like protein [Parcubacteria group bacterium]|nr:collagen-like protein [Parcubacteria group bacterium]